MQTVNIGTVSVGGLPIRLQSMTTTPTLDIAATVEQCVAIARAGADLVRITTQNVPEAQALQAIKSQLRARGVQVPLVADVHFNPQVAMVAAQYVEKVRINPGNFVSDQELASHPEALREKFLALLQICTLHQTALRIGVNHGSLSERMLAQYGDTPQGMVASAMEFLRICREANFGNVVVSMKSSNTRVMVYATRLLAQAMAQEQMCYPLHLGVTEAGEGEDGRIKSAVGIGTLLAEGLGDTIRISLTEPPQNEIPVAQKLVDYIAQQSTTAEPSRVSPVTEYSKRATTLAEAAPVGGDKPVSVWADLSSVSPIVQKDIEQLGFTFDGTSWSATAAAPDVLYIGSSLLDCPAQGLQVVDEEQENVLRCTTAYLTRDFFAFLQLHPQFLLLLEDREGGGGSSDARMFFHALAENQITNPVIICRKYEEADFETFQLRAATDCGALLLDGYGDGVMLHAKFSPKSVVQTAFGILQASRVRFSKTEYIACPGCGRTLFDLQGALKAVKEKTQHLAGLKIAVMGCIVNGPGEMADADFGYVGAGVGKVSLYKGKQCLQTNVPQAEAVDRLIEEIAKSAQRASK